jgi:branched-chain amino acid transport system substrate-binding protein
MSLLRPVKSMVRPVARIGRAGRAAVVALAMMLSTGLVPMALGAPPAGAATPHGTPILIGVIADESVAATGSSKDIPNLMAAWEKYTNAHGGINGHPVSFINKDEQENTAIGTADVTSLISDHVVAIMDNGTDDSTWAQIPAAAHVPVISLNESAAGFTYESQPDFFADGTTVLGILYGHVEMAASAGKKVFGGIYCTEVAQCAEAVDVWQADVKIIPGIKFGIAVAASETAPNYTAQCLAEEQAHVDALFPAGPPPGTIATDCAQQGYHPLFIGSEGTITQADVTNPNLNGALQNEQGFPWFLDSTPAEKTFQAAEGSVWKSATTPTDISAGWTGLQLLGAALAHVPAHQTVTAATVLKGLYSLQPTTLGGLSPTPLSFTPGKVSTQRCYFVVQIKNKKWVAYQDGKPQCEPTKDYVTAAS